MNNGESGGSKDDVDGVKKVTGRRGSEVECGGV